MNKIRDAVSIIYQSPMQDMTFPRYFNYVNEAGRVTPRSLLDTQAVILTFIEEQEKKIEQYEVNFREIEEVLSKLVDDKTQVKEEGSIDLADYKVDGKPALEADKSLDTKEFEVERAKPIKPTAPKPTFDCSEPGCDAVLHTKAALIVHERIHIPKE